MEKMLDSDGREKKSTLTPSLAIKKVDLGVKRFHLMKEVQVKCFLTLKLP
jgi:hypothetical protein